ncbi:MAG TPA: hypothetical protein VMX13_01835 [Sedimentisphaerales bacterium]|nr:hypothetical protein [Sedimentisphaerales bacterium]
MNEFIKQHQRLLHFYCEAAQALGWTLLLFVPSIGVVGRLLSGSMMSNWLSGKILYSVLVIFLNSMSLGLVLLGVGQFIRYLFDTECQPSWMLRNGTRVLYACAVIVIVSCVLQQLWYTSLMKNVSNSLLLWRLLLTAIPALAKALILVGLGRILQKVMPVIEESKTLV